MGLDACVIPKSDIFLKARVNDDNLRKHNMKNVEKFNNFNLTRISAISEVVYREN